MTLHIGDPVAEKTEWSVIQGVGAYTGKSHRLVKVGAGRYELKPTVSSRLFQLVFVVFGVLTLLCAVAALIGEFGRGQIFKGCCGMFVMSGMGGLFILFGLASGGNRIAFDKNANAVELDGKAIPLGQLHALQVLEGTFDGDGPFTAYQLNLVHKDGTRTHVVTHGNQKWLRRDVEELAEFLDVPLWDVSAEGSKIVEGQH